MTDERKAHYTPLTREEIEEEIAKTRNPKQTRHVLNDSFDGLDAPCAVVLAVKEYDTVYTALKAKGFDIVREGEEGSEDANRFLLTNSGIHFPPLNPKDSVKAVCDVVNAIGDSRILGFAIPRVAEFYCDYTTLDQSKTTSLDVNVVTEQNPELQKMLADRQMTSKEFILGQLRSIDKEAQKKTNFSSVNPALESFESDVLYRGGTLGNNPFAVHAREENRGCAYASASQDWADLFASGGSAKHSVEYKNKINGKNYGFVYKYKSTPDQKFYCDAGIQTGRASSSQGVVSSENEVETMVYPHKNPVEAVFVKIDGKEAICITDENGKFVSKDWQDFVELHAPYMVVKSEQEQKRYEGERSALRENTVAPYKLKTQSETIDLSHVKQNVNDIDLSGYKNIDFNPDVKSLWKVSFGQREDGFDLTHLKELHSICSSDFSGCKEVKLPEDISHLDNIKLPRTDTLDLTGFTKLTELGNIDCGYKEVKLPQSITSIDGFKFPPADTLDLTGFPKLAKIENIDFSQYKEVKLPQSVTSLKDVKFPPADTLDLSGFPKLAKIENIDFSQYKEIKLSQSVTSLKDVKFPPADTLDLSGYAELNKIKNVDFSGQRNVALPESLTDISDSKMPPGTLKTSKDLCIVNCDFSETKLVVGEKNARIYFNDLCTFNKDLTLDLSECAEASLGNVDMSEIKMLKLAQKQNNVYHSRFPKVVDVSACTEYPNIPMTVDNYHEVETVIENSFWRRLKAKFSKNLPKTATVMSSGDYKKKLDKEALKAATNEEKPRASLQARIAAMEGKETNRPATPEKEQTSGKTNQATGGLQNRLMQTQANGTTGNSKQTVGIAPISTQKTAQTAASRTVLSAKINQGR